MARIATVPPEVTSSNLHLHFAKAINSNKVERDIIISVLGFCGILGTPEHPGFTDSFVDVNSRALPAKRFVDMAYPACWWRASDGVNQPNLEKYFGHAI